MMNDSAVFAGRPKKSPQQEKQVPQAAEQVQFVEEKRMSVPSKKERTASFRYHSILLSVFMIIFPSAGTLSGGDSIKKSGFFPGDNLDAIPGEDEN